jgi:ATP-dependent helicase/DNAse subunit B
MMTNNFLEKLAVISYDSIDGVAVFIEKKINDEGYRFDDFLVVHGEKVSLKVLVA